MMLGRQTRLPIQVFYCTPLEPDEEQTVREYVVALQDGTKVRRDEGTKGRRDDGTKGRRDKGTKGRRDDGTKGRVNL